MGGIKYYQLAKGEEPPDEFCAVRDIGGEPSEYTFYVPESENAKLRKLCERMFKDFVSCDCELRARAGRTFMAFTRYAPELRELGIEVDK